MTEKLTKEREQEIRHVRSVTPDTDPWEAQVIDDLLSGIDRLRTENERLNEYWKTHHARWIEMTEENQKLSEENELLKAQKEFSRAKIEYLDKPANWDAKRANEIYHKTVEENHKLKTENEKLKGDLEVALAGYVPNLNILSDTMDYFHRNEKEKQKLRERIRNLREALDYYEKQWTRFDGGNVAGKALKLDSEAEGKR